MRDAQVERLEEPDTRTPDVGHEWGVNTCSVRKPQLTLPQSGPLYPVNPTRADRFGASIE